LKTLANSGKTRVITTVGYGIPEGFSPVSNTVEEPYTKTGMPREIIHKKSGAVLVFVPAGKVIMGSKYHSSWEKPIHKVKIIHPFYIGKYEVTQEQWERIMEKNPSRFKGNGNLPVEQVFWYACQNFLNKAGNGLSLPNEIQWEYACRTGSNNEFCFGNNTSKLQQYAWYRENSNSKTHPVGLLKPNKWGIYDMHGNVSEWCEDMFVWTPDIGKPNPAKDSSGENENSSRVFRGGDWISPEDGCRSVFRFGTEPDSRWDSLGFRLLKTLVDSVEKSNKESLHPTENSVEESNRESLLATEKEEDIPPIPILPGIY